MAKRDPMLDHIFIYFGDIAIPLSAMGDAADMPLSKGFQKIIDDGLLGPEYVGMEWFDVIKPSGFKLDGLPDPEDELLCSLRERWKDAEQACKEAQQQGLLTVEQLDAMVKLKRDYDMAKKLSRLG